MQNAVEILEWYTEAGVDEATDDSPRNFFAAPEPVKQAIPQIALPAKAAIQPNNNTISTIIAQARLLADAANSVEELEKSVREFEGCALKKTAMNTVFARGNKTAKLMLIGEAPGADEDVKGIPFCGASGQLLDKMLAAIEYNESNSYITNTVFWRPPANRNPTEEEIAVCKPFVEKHIALIDPDLIVLVGGVAAKAMLNTDQGITRLRGQRYKYRTPYKDKDYEVAIIYHPSYLLRQPVHKKITWEDLKAIREVLGARD